jgi:transcriptional regulator with XRE-family HTH domain
VPEFTSDSADFSFFDGAGKLFGEKIKNYRSQNGLSRAKLAQQSGVSISQISRLENGNGSSSMLICLRLAAALEIKLSDMLREIENPLPKL